MSKVEGGILGKVKGRIGDVVFSEARGKDGKENTVRQFTKPSNPQTSAQTTQRDKFSKTVESARQTGSGLWQTDWNRAVGELPGFQSYVSHIVQAYTDSDTLGVPSDLDLGDLLELDVSGSSKGSSSGEIDVSWNNTTASNGDGTDDVQVFAILKTATTADKVDAVYTADAAVRSDGTVTISGLQAGTTYIVGVYANGGSGTPGEGDHTKVEFVEQASAA